MVRGNMKSNIIDISKGMEGKLAIGMGRGIYLEYLDCNKGRVGFKIELNKGEKEDAEKLGKILWEKMRDMVKEGILEGSEDFGGWELGYEVEYI
jgi:hypothetical protein